MSPQLKTEVSYCIKAKWQAQGIRYLGVYVSDSVKKLIKDNLIVLNNCQRAITDMGKLSVILSWKSSGHKK